VREAIGLNMATMLGRMWLVACTIVAVGLGGSREDGVAAAAVLLVAFTVSLAVTLLSRSLSPPGPRSQTPTPA
jgi:predicted anti-sigma-YlaC factor YlaD